MKRLQRLVRFLSLLALPTTLAFSQEPLTRAERSGFKATASYRDVLDYLNAAQDQSDVLKVSFFGCTAEGRRLPLVILSNPATAEPADALRSGKVVVLSINNIHGGEVDGKDASLLLLRDILKGDLRYLLDRLVILLVPILNADGNERVSLLNRLTQVGPDSGMGMNTNARGLNLNRDYMKLESPEVQSLIANVFVPWWPHVTVDAHTTNGSRHGYALTYDCPHNPNGHPAPIEYAREVMLPAIAQRLEKAGFKSFYYGNWVDEKDPSQGWETYDHLPRYGDSYRGLHNRISLLSEGYAYAEFKTRVLATKEFLKAVLQFSYDHAEEIKSLLRRAEEETIAWGRDPSRGEPIGLRFQQVPFDRPVKVLAFELKEVIDSKTSEKKVLVTDEPKTYEVPYLGKFIKTRTTPRPFAYLLPLAERSLTEKLRQHGVFVERLVNPLEVEVEVFRADRVEASPRPYQGHHLVTVSGQWTTERRTFPPGTFVVPMAQRSANVAAYLLEPESDDGFVRWNYLDHLLVGTARGDSVYATWLREHLEQLPRLHRAFEERAKADPNFANDPRKQEAFFIDAARNEFLFFNEVPIYRLTRPVRMTTVTAN